MSELFDSLKLPHHTATTNGRRRHGDDSSRAAALEANASLLAETEAAHGIGRRLQRTSPATSSVRPTKGAQQPMRDQLHPYADDAAAAKDDGSSSASPSSSGSRQPGESAHRRRGESHVYWHVPPSPSLRAREAEHRRTMARAMGQERPPMASQAFQEQLLKQSATAAATAAEKDDPDGRTEPTTTGSEAASASTGKARSLSSSALRKRLSRRQSRKSFAALGGLAATLSSGKGLDGAAGSVMSELDNHLLFNRVDPDFDDVHGGGSDSAKDRRSQSSYLPKVTSERARSAVEQEQDNVQQALIEHMDRAFSQEDNVQPSTPQQRLRRVAIWTRTTSMPARMYEQPNEAMWDEAMDDFDDDVTAKVPATFISTHSMLGKRAFPPSPIVAAQADVLRQNHRRINSMSDEAVSRNAEGRPKERGSPHKRRAGSPMKMSPTKTISADVGITARAGGFVRTSSEGTQQANDEQQQPLGRQRPISHRRTTAAKQHGRGPRVGLSRSNVSSSQAATRLFGGGAVVPCDTDGRTQSTLTKHTSGPAAPFRQPLRRSPRKKSNASMEEVGATERDIADSIPNPCTIKAQEHLFLNEEDVAESKPAQVSEDAYVLEDGEDVPSSLVEIAQDMDASFEETSLDEEALCQALEEVEASQSAHAQGWDTKPSSAPSKKQQEHARAQHANAAVFIASQSSPPPYSEDGFDISIDEDVSAAILSQMDAKGW